MCINSQRSFNAHNWKETKDREKKNRTDHSWLKQSVMQCLSNVLLWRRFRLIRFRSLICRRIWLLLFLRSIIWLISRYWLSCRFRLNYRFWRRWLPIITTKNKNFSFMFSYIKMNFIVINMNIIIKCPFMPPTIGRNIWYTILCKKSARKINNNDYNVLDSFITWWNCIYVVSNIIWKSNIKTKKFIFINCFIKNGCSMVTLWCGSLLRYCIINIMTILNI